MSERTERSQAHEREDHLTPSSAPAPAGVAPAQPDRDRAPDSGAARRQQAATSSIEQRRVPRLRAARPADAMTAKGARRPSNALGPFVPGGAE